MDTPAPPYGGGGGLPPPRYVTLSGKAGSTPATSSHPSPDLHPSSGAAATAYHRSDHPLLSHSSIRRHRRRCLCRRLLLVLLVLLVLSLYIHFVVSPKLPVYTVDSLSVAVLDVNPASDTVLVDLILNVRAENMNSKIGIRHGGRGSAEMAYRGATLCVGPVPAFYQPEKNTTVVAVRMSGRNPVAPGARAALLEGEQGGGGADMPLDVHVRVPVGVRVGGGLQIGHVVTVSVACVLVVDGLVPGRTAAIRSAVYTVSTELL